MCGCLSRAPCWGPGPKPRHVPLLGIEPATQPFGSQAGTQSTEPHQPGLTLIFLKPGRSVRTASHGRKRFDNAVWTSLWDDRVLSLNIIRWEEECLLFSTHRTSLLRLSLKILNHYCSEHFNILKVYLDFLFHFRLLSGVKKLFIFQLIDGKITVRNNITVTHLTHVSWPELTIYDN